MKKYMTWAFFAFLFYFVVQFPDTSGSIITESRDWLGRMAEQSASFLRNVVS